jgi:anti-anti-sigma factor
VAAELNQAQPVFDVVGRRASRGTTWAWAREDLDVASVGRARSELAALFDGGTGPRRLLVYLGADSFVDLRGLRLLLDLVAQVQRHGGAAAVVAPPHCLTQMVSLLALEERFPMIRSVRRALWWARTGSMR